MPKVKMVTTMCGPGGNFFAGKIYDFSEVEAHNLSRGGWGEIVGGFMRKSVEAEEPERGPEVETAVASGPAETTSGNKSKRGRPPKSKE